MNEDLMAIALAAAGFVALTAFLTLRSKRKSEEKWSGSVTEIRRYESGGGDEASQARVKLQWRRDDGGTGSMDLDAASFDRFFAGLQPGDRLTKKAGEGMPAKG